MTAMERLESLLDEKDRLIVELEERVRALTDESERIWDSRAPPVDGRRFCPARAAFGNPMPKSGRLVELGMAVWDRVSALDRDYRVCPAGSY
jgi:hypothetical protein